MITCECGGPVVSDGWCQGCINHFEGYHSARVKMHERYMQLADQAFALLRSLWDAEEQEYRKSGPLLSKRWFRLDAITGRAERRYRRRATWVRELGMDEESVQHLSADQQVSWRGQVLTVIDWQCNRDPVYGPNSRRIWAEPVFRTEKGNRISVSPTMWHELTEV